MFTTPAAVEIHFNPSYLLHLNHLCSSSPDHLVLHHHRQYTKHSRARPSLTRQTKAAHSYRSPYAFAATPHDPVPSSSTDHLQSLLRARLRLDPPLPGILFSQRCSLSLSHPRSSSMLSILSISPIPLILLPMKP